MADRITDALRGPQPVQGPQVEHDPSEPGDGTQTSGYVTPDLGPFECENCVHFQPPNQCNHPQVINDSEVQGQVDPQGCCNYFKSAGNETQAEEYSESTGA